MDEPSTVDPQGPPTQIWVMPPGTGLNTTNTLFEISQIKASVAWFPLKG